MRLAIFDLDGTVLRCNSWHVFYRWSLRRQPLRAPAMLFGLAARRLRLIEGRALRDAALRSLRGLSVDAVAQIGREVCEDRLLPCVRSAARNEIARMRADGAVPVLATGAFDFLAQPLAAALEVHEVVCSRVAFADGKCLGRIAGDETRGPIKAESLRAHFAGRAVDWPSSRAYSDDVEDAPLWSLVGNPVMVAPGGDLPRGVRREIWSSD